MTRTALVLVGALFALAPAVRADGPSPGAPATIDVVKTARGIVGEPRGVALRGAALEDRTAKVADLLRCPVCQGLSVGDSPATMAQEMRGQVRELLAAGFDDEQVLATFEASYGEFVRLAPTFRGVNRLVWLAPVIGLVLGLAVVAFALRRKEAAPRDAGAPQSIAPSDPDALPDDPKLAAYVLRVREQIYGWPGGVRPPEPS